MTTDPAPRPSVTLLAEAADWLVRLEAAPGDRSLGPAFEAWCAADPAHAAAFAEVRRSWLAVPQGLAARRAAGDGPRGLRALRSRRALR
jgi:transmembrane sensor